MKLVISCLLAVCPAFAYEALWFPNIGFALPDLKFYTLQPTLPTRLAPEPRFVKRVDTQALIRGAAEKHRVPAAFIKSIVAAESNFDCDVISAKGAIGLMQLMPETAREYGADPSIPEQNVDAGTHYLRVLMDKYHRYGNSLPRVIAAYNAGPRMVDRYHGVPPFRETRRYVVRVLSFLRRFQMELTESDLPRRRREPPSAWNAQLRGHNLMNP
jgi:soluble lytic murein transglycosylase-like protein